MVPQPWQIGPSLLISMRRNWACATRSLFAPHPMPCAVWVVVVWVGQRGVGLTLPHTEQLCMGAGLF